MNPAITHPRPELSTTRTTPHAPSRATRRRAAGLGLIVAALALAGVALFLAGTVVAGVAVGAVFVGSLATANRLAPPGRRGQTVSAYFVACYCGLVIPVVGVGVASQFIGDFRPCSPCPSCSPSCASSPWPASSGPSRRTRRRADDRQAARPEAASELRDELRDPGPRPPGRDHAARVPRPARRDTRQDTLLRGAVADQAALHGVLAQIEALGLELLEVRRRQPETS